MNKKIIFLLSLIMLLVISIPNVSAEYMTGTCTNSDGGTYNVETSENTILHGYCINASLGSPSSAKADFVIYNDTSSVSNNIKELIVKNYRGSSPSGLQSAIWSITDGHDYNDLSSSSQSMLNNIENLTIGNSYSYFDGENTHNFTFYLGHPTSDFSSVQSLILFYYNEPKSTNNPNNNNIDPTNDNIDLNNDNIDSDDDDIDSDDDDDIVFGDNIDGYGSIDPTNSEVKKTVKAAEKDVGMKKTGMPIIAILLSISLLIGVLSKRKK